MRVFGDLDQAAAWLLSSPAAEARPGA
jgi:hypothetical protein